MTVLSASALPFDDAAPEVAIANADRAEADHRTLVAAIESGRLEAREA